MHLKMGESNLNYNCNYNQNLNTSSNELANQLNSYSNIGEFSLDSVDPHLESLNSAEIKNNFANILSFVDESSPKSSLTKTTSRKDNSITSNDQNINFDFALNLESYQNNPSHDKFEQNSIFLESFLTNLSSSSNKKTEFPEISNEIEPDLHAKRSSSISFNPNINNISESLFMAKSLYDSTDSSSKSNKNSSSNPSEITYNTQINTNTNIISSKGFYNSNSSYNDKDQTSINLVDSTADINSNNSSIYTGLGTETNADFLRNSLGIQLPDSAENSNSNNNSSNYNISFSSFISSNFDNESRGLKNPVTPATILNLTNSKHDDPSLSSKTATSDTYYSKNCDISSSKLGTSNISSSNNLEWFIDSEGNPNKSINNVDSTNDKKTDENIDFDKFLKDNNINLGINSLNFSSSIINHSAPPGQFMYFQQPPSINIEPPAIGIGSALNYLTTNTIYKLSDNMSTGFNNNNPLYQNSEIRSAAVGTTEPRNTTFSGEKASDFTHRNSDANSTHPEIMSISKQFFQESDLINSSYPNSAVSNMNISINSIDMIDKSKSYADIKSLNFDSTDQDFKSKDISNFRSPPNSKIKDSKSKYKTTTFAEPEAIKSPTGDFKITDPSPRLLPKIIPRVHSKNKRSSRSTRNSETSEKKLKKNPGIYSEILKPTTSSALFDPLSSGNLLNHGGDRFKNQVSNFNLGPSALIIPKTLANEEDLKRSNSHYSITKTLNECEIDPCDSPTEDNELLFSPIESSQNYSNMQIRSAAVNNSEFCVTAPQSLNISYSTTSNSTNLQKKISKKKKPTSAYSSPNASDYSADNIIEKLTSKSNYQNVIDGESDKLGLSYPKEIYNKLLSRRTVHKAAEQQRRDIQRCAFDELKTLLPELSEDKKPSKVSILSHAVKEITSLKNKLTDKDEEIANLKKQIETLKSK
ncbi:hypothetical protein AYI70_g6603 [Smittium culicis]|uniref:BHLH domain-containing protein n=1 Tax=Smittium culicis TaxID=133412 RepID=A0A1R1XP93_9FUNG|nr:hypothetical protein AYI70_g6603 [Smittium culicis]